MISKIFSQQLKHVFSVQYLIIQFCYLWCYLNWCTSVLWEPALIIHEGGCVQHLLFHLLKLMIKNSLFLDPRSSVVCIAPHNPVSIFTGLGRVIYRFVCQCARAGGARRAGAAIANNILISHCLDQSLLRGQHQIIGSPGPSARPHTNNNFYTFLVFFSVQWRSFNLNLRQQRIIDEVS